MKSSKMTRCSGSAAVRAALELRRPLIGRCACAGANSAPPHRVATPTASRFLPAVADAPGAAVGPRAFAPFGVGLDHEGETAGELPLGPRRGQQQILRR